MFHPRLLLATPVLCFALLFVSARAASAADESIVVTARYFATLGREAEVEARFLQFVAFVRKADPGVTIQLQRSQKDPTIFLFYEVFPTAAAREAHGRVTQPAFVKEYGPTPAGFYSRAQEVETYTPLAN